MTFDELVSENASLKEQKIHLEQRLAGMQTALEQIEKAPGSGPGKRIAHQALAAYTNTQGGSR